MILKLRRIEHLWAIVVGVSTFVLLLPLSRLDYDSHHDGIMIASAVAQHEGFPVHNGSFAQYGPMSTWIQSLFLFFGQPAGITLRVTNVLLLSLTAFLVADLGRQSEATIKLSRLTTTAAAVTWILLCDVFNWVPLLPWSSVVAQFLIVAGIYSLFRALYLNGRVLQINSQGLIVLSGFLWGLTLFTRINVSLVLLGSFSVLWGYTEICVRSSRKIFRLVAFGVVSALVLVILTLTFTNSLLEWWQQAVIWPLNWSSGLQSSSGLFLRLQSMFEAMSFEVAITLILIALLGIARDLQTKNRVIVQTIFFILYASLFVFFAWSSSPTIWSANGIPDDLLNFGILRMNIFGLLFWLGLTSSAILLGKVVRGMFTTIEDRAVGLLWTLFILVSVSGTAQIVPVSDSRHFWWGMPLILIMLFHLVAQYLKSNLLSFLLLAVPVVLLCLSTFHLLPRYLQQPRIAAPTGSVAEKMLLDARVVRGTPNSANYFQNIYLLESLISREDQVIFLVRDGDLSVFDGHYHSLDREFVSWGPSRRFSDRAKDADAVVLDVDFVSAFQPEMYSLGFEPVATRGSIAIWKKTK